MLLFLLILLVLVLSASFYYTQIFKNRHIYAAVRKIPGPEATNFFVGNVWKLRTKQEKIMEIFMKLNVDHYPIYCWYAMGQGLAALLTPEDYEIILSNPIHNAKGHLYFLLDNWLQDGLLTSTGTKWQTRRKILTPAFHFNILQKFIPIFNDESDELVETIKQQDNQECVNIKPLVTQFTLKAIAETAMGTKFQFFTKKDAQYKQAIHDICQVFLYRLLNPWFLLPGLHLLNPHYYKELKAVNFLHKYTKEVIRNREMNFSDTDTDEHHDVYTSRKRLTMLDLLLSAKINENVIDDKGIQEEVDTFMFEGHDTTGEALSFLLMLLACNRNCQQTVYEEMLEVLYDLSKKPSYTDLQNLKYLERCVKETLRLYPSVYFIMRTLGEDVYTHTGYFLPKGTSVVINIHGTHHNPRIYPNPEKFDPDRFLTENSRNRHPYAYLPFSAGPRNCIGQKFAILELKAAVCSILSSFKLEPIDTPETITLLADIVLRTKNGIKIKFVPRK